MLGRDGAGGTLVRSEDPGRLAALLSGAGRAVELQGADALVVPGATLTRSARWPPARASLRELVASGRSLEDAFLDLTAEAA